MSMFLPENSQGAPASGVSSITPASPQTTQEDVALMQRVLAAAATNPLAIPDDLMSYILDYIQASNLVIPIGQVFGYQRIAPQVITDFAQVPTPADGQIVLLKVGASAPYTYVQMMYDQKQGQWASENFPLGGANNVQTTSDSYAAVGGAVGIPWAPVHTLGLTFQCKWAGTLNGASTQADAQVLVTFSDGSSAFTTSSVMNQSSAGDGVTRAVGVDWTTITDPGAYVMAVVGMQAKRNGAGTTTLSAGIVGRFLK